jgi:hypothetical protein
VNFVNTPTVSSYFDSAEPTPSPYVPQSTLEMRTAQALQPTLAFRTAEALMATPAFQTAQALATMGLIKGSLTDTIKLITAMTDTVALTPVAAPTMTTPITPADIAILVDFSGEKQPISPWIYGLSGAHPAVVQAIRPSLQSWGGDRSSRYNWKIGNAWNTGADGVYQNSSFGFTTESVSDAFIREANAAGATVRLTLPTIGWVAKDTNPETCSFPDAEGRCTNAGGASCAKPGATADPALANIPADPAFIADWVRSLQGSKADVRFFAMDNKPELWGYQHYDVRPNCTTYADILERYTMYATAVREVAPEAELMGPVSCCWNFYWNSAAGEADKQQHNNQDFLPWFLEQMRKHDQQYQKRTLDILDVHYFPEGVYNNEVNQESAARRLRSTRSLWDPSYVDESWIKEPVQLIPRLQGLIRQHYPNTKLAISEWNWGADTTINGALAIADVLGIFGREQVYLASYWRSPEYGTPGMFAFKMYTNYDDAGSRFGDLSVRASSTDHDQVSAYGAIDLNNKRINVMLINKLPDTVRTVELNLKGITLPNQAMLYRYSRAIPDQITRQQIATDFDKHLTLPPYSVTMISLDIQP